jgi:hypothetical protein
LLFEEELKPAKAKGMDAIKPAKEASKELEYMMEMSV